MSNADIIKEDILSTYIDSLNNDEKPVEINDDIDDEMLELFETVKAVKRLKDTDTAELFAKTGKITGRRRFNYNIKVATTIAAVFIIFISSLAIKNFASGSFGKKSTASDNAATYNMPMADSTDSQNGANNENNKNAELKGGTAQNFTTGAAGSTSEQVNTLNAKDAGMPEASTSITSLEKTAPERSMVAAKNNSVVTEMQTSYDSLSSYTGVIEIQSINNGKVSSDENVKITYKKPDKYITVESIGTYVKKEYSDGDKLYTVEGSRVSVDFVYPVKDLWRYHIQQQIKELEAAFEIREAGSEALYGKDTQIYEYKSIGDEKYNRIWVDKKTKLPVKREINNSDGKTISVFKELTLNAAVEDSSFNYNIKSSDDVYYLNEKVSRSTVEDFIPQISGVINCVPEYLKLQKTVKLNNDLYNYYMNFTDESKTSFLDVYVSNIAVTGYYKPGDAHGKLQDGWTESESGASDVFKIYTGKNNTVKWIGKNYEIVFVSNVDTMGLLKILEDASNAKIIPLSEEQLSSMGVSPKP